MTRTEIETALANGTLWAAMRNGRYWKLRRNGATQTWKTRPTEFRIPVKAGLKSCGDVTHTSSVAKFNDFSWQSYNFVVCSEDPNIPTVKKAVAKSA